MWIYRLFLGLFVISCCGKSSFILLIFLSVFGQETHAKSDSGRSPSSLKLLRKVAALRGKRANQTPDAPRTFK